MRNTGFIRFLLLGLVVMFLGLTSFTTASGSIYANNVAKSRVATETDYTNNRVKTEKHTNGLTVTVGNKTYFYNKGTAVLYRQEHPRIILNQNPNNHYATNPATDNQL